MCMVGTLLVSVIILILLRNYRIGGMLHVSLNQNPMVSVG